MRDENNRNLLLAIVLSVGVLLGWNFFYGVPQMEQQKRAQQAQQVAPPLPGQPGQAGPVPGASPAPGSPSVPIPGTLPAPAGATVPETREAALQRSPRVSIDTPSLAGS